MARIVFNKTLIITVLLVLSSLWIVTTPEPVSGVAGSITGTTTWSGTVQVTGNIYIETGANLTINAGTNVWMRGPYEIFIAPNASLYINGASGNEVTIQNGSQWGGWKAITLNNSWSSAYIKYAHLYNGDTMINATNGAKQLHIIGSTFNNSVIGIDAEGLSPQIRDSHFHNITFPIIFAKANGVIYNSRFVDNDVAVIWADSSGKPKFDNNWIIRSGGSGLDIGTTNMHITNNTIMNCSNHGINSNGNSAYMYKNKIYNSAREGITAGIRLYALNNVEDSIVDSNLIYYNGRGIFVDRDTVSGIVSAKITNNNIKYNKKVGMEVHNGTLPRVNNNYIMNNDYGIWVQKMYEKELTVENCTITGNTIYDWYVSQIGSVPTSLNSKFNTVFVTANYTTQYLKVVWFLNMTVLELGTNAPVQNAEITISPMNDSSVILDKRYTNAQGKSNYIDVVEKYIRHATNITYMNPYYVKADKITFPRQYVAEEINNYGMTKSQTLTVYLEKNLAPTIPTNLRPASTHDTTPRIEWDVSTDINGDPITYYIKVGTTFGGGQLLTETPVTTPYFDIPFQLQYDNVYYIAIKAGDNRFANSTWVYLNLSITNVKPTAPTITITPAKVYTTTDINVEMTTPSTDDTTEVSVYGETIRYTVYIDINDVRQVQYDYRYVNMSDVDFIIDHNDFSKGDIINITVIPFDGHGPEWEGSGSVGAGKHPGNGTPAYVTIEVLNIPPVINSTVADIIMDEDTIYVVPSLFADIFKDPDLDKLKFEYAGDPNIDVDFHQNTGRLTIIPKPNYYTTDPSGKDQLIFIANDTAGGITQLVVNVTVVEVNDPPQIHVDIIQIAYQGKRHYINITVTDPADPHDTSLELLTNYTTWSISDKITYVENNGKKNITLHFIAGNDDIGVYYLNISAKDGKDTRYLTLAVNVLNVNDKPHAPVLVTPENAGNAIYQIYNTTDNIDFEATAFDPDIQWGDSLKFLWTSNISGLTLANKDKFKTKINLPGHHRITITVTDQEGAQNSTYFDVFVVDPFGVALPETELIYPNNNMKFPSTTPNIPLTLSWDPRPHKYSNLLVYDLEYWVDDPNSVSTRINGIKETEYTLNVMVDQTYYWWVIPRLGGQDGVEGRCYSGKWSFFVKFVTEIPEPKAYLVSPLDNDKTNFTSMDFEWASDDEFADDYFYQVFIDKVSPPGKRVVNYWTDTKYTLTGLEDDTTYYWYVVPYYGTKAGQSSETWILNVDWDFIPNPKVTVTPDEFDFEMEPSDTKEFTYTVENTGNTIEVVEITVTPDEILEPLFTKDFDEEPIKLEPGDKVDIKFTLKLLDMGIGDYKIRLKIASSDLDISERKDVNIKVKPEEKEDGVSSDMGMIIGIIVVVIIILVVVALLFIFRKKPKPEEAEEEREEPARPAARPAVVPVPTMPPAKPGGPAAEEPAKIPAPAAAPVAAPKPAAPAPAVSAPAAKPELPSAAPAPADKAGEGDSKAEAVEEDGAKEDAVKKCPTCGADMPAGATECPVCMAKAE